MTTRVKSRPVPNTGRISVMTVHDAMASEYDRIVDPWYTHLYERVHTFLLGTDLEPGVALDVGCGTGLQSHLLASRGWRVHGFDRSPELVSVAERKSTPLWGRPESYFERDMARFEGGSGRYAPTFTVGRAEDPTQYRQADLLVCVGSVLNFVPDVDLVLSYMRAARRVVLEVEMKHNLDLLWPIADRLLGGRLGYDQTMSQSIRNLVTPGDVEITYPFELQDGTRLELPMRLFDRRSLLQRFERQGFKVKRQGCIHSVSNVIPSTIMHRMKSPIRPLLAIDRVLSQSWPFSRLGSSALFELAYEGES